MISPRSLTLACVLACPALVLAGEPPAKEAPPASAPAKAEAAGELGPKVGAAAPDANIVDRMGEATTLAKAIEGSPTVIVFYRGAWCPYCVRQIRDWDAAMPELKAAGAKVMAISLEKASFGAQMSHMQEIDFPIYADPAGEAARAYNVRYDLSAEQTETLKKYQIDLSQRNATAQWELVHPATIVIDAKGVVRNVWVDTDYKSRVAPAKVIEAVKALPSS